MPIFKFIFSFLFALNVFAQTDDLLISSVSGVGPWSKGVHQEVKIKFSLPAGFHAYTDQFKILNIKPEEFDIQFSAFETQVEFFDKYSKKVRNGLYENGTLKLAITTNSDHTDVKQKVNFELRYQICSENVCYLPKNLSIELVPQQLNSTGTALTAPLKKSFSLFESFDELIRSSLWLSFLSIFVAGILTSFTPCIFPMLPITISILGYHADKNSRMKNFSRALAYVLGIAVTYSSLGVIAALTGSLFGSMLTNKYVLVTLIALFFLMALSMWGAFELQAPAIIRNRFGTGKGHHSLGGAFIMGLVAGVVASPCVGPVLISVLTYVSTTKDILLGFSLLFTFAMGLGLIFIVIGLFSSALKLLPKSGIWMESIKFILGAGMWGAALYYSQFVFSERWWMALIALSFVLLSIWKGAFSFNNKKYLQRSFLLALFVFSCAVLVVSLFRPDYLSKNLHTQVPEAQQTGLKWAAYSEEALAQAQRDLKPVLIDFYADWCGACHELAEKTFSTGEFKELSESFLLVKFDATEDNEQIRQVLKKYNVKGLPTVLFINRNGEILKELTFTQFLTMNELKPKMQEALK